VTTLMRVCRDKSRQRDWIPEFAHFATKLEPRHGASRQLTDICGLNGQTKGSQSSVRNVQGLY